MNAYKTRLEEMLATLTEELTGIGIHDPQNPTNWIAVPEKDDTNDADENLAADNVEEWNERTALVAELETRYNNITAALARIETGTFGICEVCSAEIEPARLDVNPAARTCIAHREEII